MFISPAEALRRYDVSKPTLYQDMSKGKLSFKFDARKKRRIDVAELERVYEKRVGDEQSSGLEDVRLGSKNTKPNVKSDAEDIEALKKEIEYLKSISETHKSSAEDWREACEKAQSNWDNIKLLIEDRSKGSRDKGNQSSEGWEQSIKQLEQRIANQENEARQEREKLQRQLLHTREKLKEEKNKPLLKKLFG